MKKILIRMYVVILLLLCVGLGTQTVKAALPYPYQKNIVKEKKIEVKEKGYLQITSTTEANHIVFGKKLYNPKNYQSHYGKKVYFALKPGTYYVQSSTMTQFKVKYKFVKAGNYKANATWATAQSLSEGDEKIALSFKSDYKIQNYRYYKITPQKTGRISFTRGMLFDSDGNMIPCIVHRFFPRVYYTNPNMPKKIQVDPNGYIGADTVSSTVLTDLEAGKEYHLRIDLREGASGYENIIYTKKKSVTSAIGVRWEMANEKIQFVEK